MTVEEIADVLAAYHENLMLMARTAAPHSPERADYEFRTAQGALLPKLDDIAEQVRQLGAVQRR